MRPDSTRTISIPLNATERPAGAVPRYGPRCVPTADQRTAATPRASSRTTSSIAAWKSGKAAYRFADPGLEPLVVGRPPRRVVIDEARRVELIHDLRPSALPALLDPASDEGLETLALHGGTSSRARRRHEGNAPARRRNRATTFGSSAPAVAQLPTAGSVNVNVAPSPGALRTEIVPPCAWTMPRAMERPRPEPPYVASGLRQ